MVLSIRLDDELVKKIDDTADVLKISRSGLIRLLLVSCLDGDVTSLFEQIGKVVSSSGKTENSRVARNKVLA